MLPAERVVSAQAITVFGVRYVMFLRRPAYRSIVTLTNRQAKGFQGPGIMEIPPDERVFENLSSSFTFLEAISGGR